MANELFKVAQSGLEKRLNVPWVPKEKLPLYRERLLFEANCLHAWGVGKHFLQASKLVCHLKCNGFIVGPSGGELNACLLAYSLGIHDVDPICHGLIFESYFDAPKSPVFQLQLCHAGYVEARNYLIDRYGEQHIAWEGYAEHDPLIITDGPIDEVLKVAGERAGFSVAAPSKQSEEIRGLRIQLTPVPILGRISRTSRFLHDVMDDSEFTFDFEAFRKAPDVINKSERDGPPDWVPDERVPVLDSLKKLGPPENFDDFIFAYATARFFSNDVNERELTIGEWLKVRRLPPWANAISDDKALEDILACSNGVVLYKEQIAQLVAHYLQVPMSEAIGWFAGCRHWSSMDIASKHTEFIYLANQAGHSEAVASKLFDFLRGRAIKMPCYKSHVVGETLLANGAAQMYIFFGMAGA